MSWSIKKADIPFISIGAKMLSCGGGGDPKTIEYLLRSIMKEDDTITVKTINEVSNEWVVPVAVAGSPVLFSEDLPEGKEGAKVLSIYEQVSGTKANAVISLEIGGLNALFPLLIALQTNLPVIDGDGMGRAFPELDMTTYFLNNIPLLPLAAQTGEECKSLVEMTTPSETLTTIKEMVLRNTGFVHLACYGMTDGQLLAGVIPGTLKLALELGKTILYGSTGERLLNMIRIIDNSVYGELKLITIGYVSLIKRWFNNGTLVGTCGINGKYSHDGKTIEISFQNEFLSILYRGEYVCTTPDLILLLDSHTFMPKLAAELQEGDVVFVIAITAPSILRTKDMLELVGPRRFGINADYRSIQWAEGEEVYEAWD
jgi:uncharacterized protein